MIDDCRSLLGFFGGEEEEETVTNKPSRFNTRNEWRIRCGFAGTAKTGMNGTSMRKKLFGGWCPPTIYHSFRWFSHPAYSSLF